MVSIQHVISLHGCYAAWGWGKSEAWSPYLFSSESSPQQVHLTFLLVTDLNVVNFVFVQHHADVWVVYCLLRTISYQKSTILEE